VRVSFTAVRGPLFSGPLGGAAVLEAILRRLRGVGTTVVIGPLWLGETLSAEIPIVLLVEPEERDRARRIARRTAAAQRRLTVIVAGVDLPLALGSVDALLIENIAALEMPAASEWLSTLVPTLRAGGRLLTADVTEDPLEEARLAGLWLASALTHIAQERPRDGVVLTAGNAPSEALVRARFEAA
jgi:hypothetical protein